MSNFIDTDAFSAHYREKMINLKTRQLLITNFYETAQEKDLTEPANCKGFGRIRHFKRKLNSNWLPNPLPIDPAIKALKLQKCDQINAQIFQNAACNWRCWYCYVPFALLSANKKHSDWLSASQLMDLYSEQSNPPQIIDLTGGQPDLTPEWVLWMIQEINNRNLQNKIFLWSDDNLSNDYFWRYLSEKDIEQISSYPNYGRVCCFKGFDEKSFSFNTLAAPDLFDRQFELMKRLLATNIDLYAYVTITSAEKIGIKDKMRKFIDRLQTLSEFLPLRTVPLKVEVFNTVQERLDCSKKESLENQNIALDVWKEELSNRFSPELLEAKITEIILNK